MVTIAVYYGYQRIETINVFKCCITFIINLTIVGVEVNEAAAAVAIVGFDNSEYK